MKRLSRLLTLLLLPVFAFASNTDTSAVSAAQDTAWYHLLVEQASSKLQQQIARNEHLKQEGRESEMQFVINVSPNGGEPYLIDEGVGGGAAMLKDYRIVKDTLESHLKKIYSTYRVEAYLMLLNYFTVKMKHKVKGTYSVDDIFNSSLLDDTLNLQALKDQHELITNGIAYTRGIFADTSARIVLSVGIYKGLMADSVVMTYFCSKIKPNKNNGYVSKQVAPLLYSYLQHTDADPKDGSFAYPRYHVSSLEKAIASSRQKAKILQTLTVEAMADILQEFSQVSDYAALSAEERLHVISVLLTEKLRGDYNVNHIAEGEGAVIQILKNTPPGQVEQLLTGLEGPSTLNERKDYTGDKSDTTALITRLYGEMDDRFMFLGGKNSTRMMSILKDLLVSSPKFGDRLLSVLEDADKLDAHTLKWQFADVGGHVPIGFTEIVSVELDDAGGVKVYCHQVTDKSIKYIRGATPTNNYKLEWDNLPPKSYGPFDLIFFTNVTDLSVLDEATEVHKGEVVLVPAIFLKYADHNDLVNEITTTTAVTIDLATLATGYGGVIRAVGWIRKGIVIFEMANAAANLALQATPTELQDSTFREVVEWSNNVMLVIGGVQLAKGGIKNLPAAMKAAKSITTKLSRQVAVNFIAAVMKVEVELAQLKNTSKAADEIFALRDQIVREWKVAKGEDLLAAVEKLKVDDFYKTVDELTATYDAERKLSSALRDEIYNYFKQRKWDKLVEIFQKNDINGGWPPGNGGYNAVMVSMKKGSKLDRYQYRIKTQPDGSLEFSGEYVSPVEGKPFDYESRALRGNETDYDIYYQIEVLKDIDFPVEKATIIPWWGHTGNGIQFRFPKEKSIPYLIENGFIKVTPISSPNGKIKF